MNAQNAVLVEVGLFLVIYAILAWKRVLPSVESIRQFAAVLDSKGGNVIILSAFSIIFFASAMRLVYYLLENTKDGKIDVSNAIIMSALQFVTGGAFGGAFASLLKTLTGQESGLAASKSETKTEVVRTTTSEPPA